MENKPELVNIGVVYSLITRPLIVAVKEMAEWGLTREQIEAELSFALRKGWTDCAGGEEQANAGH